MQTGKPTVQRRQRGMGYLMVLFAITALGLLAATAGQVWRSTAQRAREGELLFAGQQFRQALDSYHALVVGGAQQYPADLKDLLDDRRSQVTLRHLRKIYIDPMTGQADWVLVTAGERIVGLHSRSTLPTYLRSFEGADAGFNGSLRYDQWVFRAGASGTAGSAGSAP
jgi:type II secretory pathway pseudopilin PulG